MKKCFLVGALMAVVIAAFPIGIVYAAENTVGFSVKALLPENQISQDKTYFDLAMQQRQEQTVEVQVYNSTNEAIAIQAKLHTASTNINGLIDYTHETKPDESMKIVFTDIAKLNAENIIIPPNSSVKLQIDIKMPEQSFDGIILGGIEITKSIINEDKHNTQGVAIQNQYAYVIGVCLSETDNSVDPSLHLKYIKTRLINGYTAVVANIQNSAAIDIQDLSISAQIYRSGSDDVMYSVEKANVCMAPNSNFDFAVEWNRNKIEAGTYRLHLLAEKEEMQWEWDEMFTIEPDEAVKVNDEAIITEVEGNSDSIFWVFTVLILLITTLASGFYLGRRRNK